MENEGHNETVAGNSRRGELGYDELNLAEFPLAAVTERFLGAEKTVVFEDTVWDRKARRHLPRKLVISGSDYYGLPTARDDDALLACVQLSGLGDFASKKLFFSRYELLKLLRWKDETRNYRRLTVSLRRWKGVTVYSNRAFFDKARQSWVSKDFAVLDNLHIYEREEHERRRAPASSWLVWNDVLFESFQAGYLKRLDWDLYCRLESPIAKRLYRFLDKRFYHGNRVEIDMHELAFRKVRLTGSYSPAQIKRLLSRGIEELEAKWELAAKAADARFVKLARSQWTVVFDRRRRRAKPKPKPPQAVFPETFECPRSPGAGADPRCLEMELSKRNIGPAMAEELVSRASAETIQTALELFDWYNAQGRTRDAGFLVTAIREPERIRSPKGFESRAQRQARERRKAERKLAQARLSRRQEAKRRRKQRDREEPFRRFWNALSAEDRERFETEAVRKTDSTKRQGYFRAMGRDDRLFEGYRQAILQEHFRRNAQPGESG